jgi:hypothetical protein
MTRRTKTWVMMMATMRVHMWTWLEASLHRRSAAEDATETTMTYMMSSAVEMHAAGLKIDAEIRSGKSKNSVMKGTRITMVLTMTNLTGSGH